MNIFIILFKEIFVIRIFWIFLTFKIDETRLTILYKICFNKCRFIMFYEYRIHIVGIKIFLSFLNATGKFLNALGITIFTQNVIV